MDPARKRRRLTYSGLVGYVGIAEISRFMDQHKACFYGSAFAFRGLPPRRPESTGAARRVGQVVALLPFHGVIRRDDELRDAVTLVRRCNR